MDKHSIGAAAVRHLLRPRAGSCLRFEQKGIGRQELGAGNTATSLSKHGASVHSHNYRASSIGYHNHGEALVENHGMPTKRWVSIKCR